MPIELSWNTAVRATFWHAADRALAGGRFVDSKLAAELRPHVDRLAAAVRAAGYDPTALFAQLLPRAVNRASTLDILRASLAAMTAFEPMTRGQQSPGDEAPSGTVLLQEVEGALAGVEGALSDALPRLDKELSLRAGPIQMQWEARGPGFVRAVERLLRAPIEAAGADSLHVDVALVYPVCGGYGASYAAQRVVNWEALLTDVEPRVPELLRLGWLVTQQLLAAQLANTAVADDHSAQVVSLAAAAVALTASEDVELARDDRATLELALKTWRPPQADGPATAALVSDWWSAVREQPELAATALADLARRLTLS